MPAEKGDPIRFIRGVYAGCKGWINKSKNNKKKSNFRHVIVELDDGVEKATRVKFNSYRKPFSEAHYYEEAAVQQHSDLEFAMIRLAEMFVECGIHDNMHTLRLFDAELRVARANQTRMGGKARYRNVLFTDPPQDDYIDQQGQEQSGVPVSNLI